MHKLQYSNLIKKLDCYKSLEQTILDGNLPHAVMLLGQDKKGLEIFAKLIAGLYLGSDDENEKSLVYNYRHTDCIVYPNQHDEKAKDAITVADAKEIAKSVYTTPLRGDRKVYMILGAQNMNPQSQNKLLKTLEEPPRNVHFIITCANQMAVLPTVVSRCKKIDVPLFTYDDLQSTLVQYHSDTSAIAFAVGVSGGSLTMALDLLTDKRKMMMFLDCLQVLKSLKSSRDAIMCVSMIDKYKDSLSQIIDFLQIILRDVALASLSQYDFIALKQHKDELKQIAQMYSFSAVERIMDALMHAKLRISTNSNSNSTIDQLVFSIAEIKAKYK